MEEVFHETEFVDSPADVAMKTELLLKLMDEATNIVILTGAGVSTNSGIPDFRGDEGLDNKPMPLVVIGFL